MSRPTWILIAIALLTTLAAGEAHAQLEDAVGVYFDPEYTVTEVINPDVPHLATAYLVLMNPTVTGGGLGGWECRIEFDGYSPLTQWHPSGLHLNFKTPPDFIVAMTDPLPITGPQVLLASFDMYIAEPTPFTIDLVPLRHAPSIEDNMSYIPWDDKELLTPMTTWTPGATVAAYNWVPYCEVDLTTIQFGDILTGTTVIESVQVTNQGGLTLVVDPVIEGSNGFSLYYDNGPYYLAHGESQRIYVAYSPTDAGSDQATLDLGTGCDPVLLYGAGHVARRSYIINPPTMDFGEVALGGTFSRTFQFVNDGDVAITVEPSVVGCNFVEVSPASYEVGPDRTITFRVAFEPGVLGTSSCEIGLGSDLSVLPFTAEVLGAAEVLALSANLLDFGELEPGGTAYRTVQLTNTSGATLELRASVPGNTPFWLISPSENYTISIAPGTTRDYRVMFEPSVVGEYTDSLVFAGVGLSVNLVGRAAPVPGEVYVYPRSIAFGNVTTNYFTTRTVEVRNFADSTVVIAPEFVPDQPEFRFYGDGGPWTLAFGESQIVTVIFQPTETTTYATTLILAGDIPGIPISGTGLAPSYYGLSVEPAELNFGLWPVGADAELEARVRNRSSYAVDMDVFLDPAGSPFVLSAGGSVGVLPPNSTAIIRVRFQPTAEGDFGTSVHLSPVANLGPIPVTASARAEVPVCVLSETSLAFPPTGTGGGTSLDLTISNTGTAPMQLDPVSNCAAFTGVAVPDVLEPGQTGTVTVIFAPDEVGDYACELFLGTGFCAGVTLEGSAFFGSPSGNDEDRVGVFFDPGFSQPWIFDVENGDEFEAYLVLKNPAGTDDITGFECRVLDTDDVLLQGATLPSGGYNFSELPEFTVGLGVPQPAAEYVLLATLSYLAVGVPDNSPIILVPKQNPSIPDAMAMISGPEHVLRPMYPDSGQPAVAWVNYWDRSVGIDDPVDEPEVPAAVVTVTRLLPNVPNPFNPETAIRYEVAREGRVRITVYDVMGRRVATLLDEVRGVGPDQVVWRGRDDRGRSVPSGAYYVRLEGPRLVDTRKVMLLK